jgi:hypothetical protein
MTTLSPNAFAGVLKEPTDPELALALGSTKPVWDQLLADLAADHGIQDHEWKSYSPKVGWSLRVKRGKRTIVWLTPCEGSFRVAFILGDKAMEAARQSPPSQRMLHLLDTAERYPEGNGIRLDIKGPRDLPTVMQLAEIKLRN